MLSFNMISSLIGLFLLSTVLTSPVLPMYELDLLPTDMACLYICNICYDGMPKEMDVCANDICSKPDCNILDWMKIGRECKNYKTIAEYSTKSLLKH